MPCCSNDSEMIFSTPRICWTVDSSGDVRKASTVSGDAPGQLASMKSRGSSALGSISIGMFRQAKAPRSATAK